MSASVSASATSSSTNPTPAADATQAPEVAKKDSKGDPKRIHLIEHEDKSNTEPVPCNAKALCRCVVVSDFVEGNDGDANAIPEVWPVDIKNREALILMVEYMEKYQDEPIIKKEAGTQIGTGDKKKASDDKPGPFYGELTDWDNEWFDKKVDNQMLYHVMVGANYIDQADLLDKCVTIVASMMKGKSTQQLRDLFDLENDFTPEEEEKIRRENEWAEDR